MWKKLGNPLRTLGFDGFADDCSRSVINITDAAKGHTACRNSINVGISSSDAKFYFDAIMNEFNNEDNESGVENIYCGIVCDNTKNNLVAVRMVQDIFPLLLFCGCIAHLFNLLIEDLFNIPVFNSTLEKVHNVAKFIKSHKRVKELYSNICKTEINGKKGNVLNLYPLTRFAYGDKMLFQYVRNKMHLIALIEHDSFDDVCLSISDAKVSEFEDILIPPHGTEHATLDTLIAMIHEITGKVNLIIHHVEQSKCKASWINCTV